MVNVLKVKLWDELVGTISVNKRNPSFYVFQFDEDFVKTGLEICPITMQLNNALLSFTDLDINSFKGLPPLIVDSLPDRYGDILLSVWKEKNNIGELTPLDILSYIGKRGMGALEFEPSKTNDKEIFDIDVESLNEVANAVFKKRDNVLFNIDDENSLERLIDVGSSIGGARAKAVIAIDEKGNLKSGQIANLKGYKYYILKFDGVNGSLVDDNSPTYYTRIEYMYYLMAKEIGIDMNESFLLKKNKKYHFVTKRFDRDDNGEKIHMLSLAGMASFNYKHPGENAYEEVPQILSILGCDFEDTLQIYKRMVFNVIACNKDDHVKNISFLMNKNGVWKLSPAYDLSFAFKANGEWTSHHQMRINNKVDNFTLEDLLASARNMSIKKSKALEIINKVKNVVLNIDSFAEKAYLPKEVIDELRKHFVII